jgi:tetratricopeptide (TPR) repeat protein
MSANAFGSDWAQLEAGTFRFRDPLNRERRFIPLRLDDAPIKGSLAQFLYINWCPADCEQAYAKLLAGCRGEEILFSPTLLTSALLKSKIEEARVVARKHDEENAIRLWEEVRKQADDEGNKATIIRAQLEIALLRLRSGADLDDIVSVLDKCIQDAKSVDLGDDRSRLLQLLGEAYRLKGNFDQARGFITSALEHSRTTGRKLDEGWALLALSALEKSQDRKAVSEAGLDLIQRAYDCFSSVYVSGDQEKQRAAKEGFAACHTSRAAIYDHHRLDDAMAEFARAADVFRELGADFEWNLADLLFQRGDLHSRADDPQLAAKDFSAAAELFKKLGDLLMEAKCVMGIAELLDQRGRRLDSKQYYEAAAAIAMQQKNRKNAAWIWFRYACKLFELREFEQGKSIFSTLLAADWLRPRQRLDVLKMLCLCAKGSRKTEELERYSKAALEIIDDQIATATSADERRRLIISKGQSLDELEEHDRAVACFRRGIEAFEAVNDRDGVVECWSHIAQVMGKTKKRKEEREAYEKVLNLIGDEDDSFHLPMTLTMLAQLEIFEKHFDEARKLLDRAERKNEKLLSPMVLFLVQDLRSKLPPT